MPEEDRFFALKLAPAGACRATAKQPGLPFARLRTALRLRPRRALSSAEAAKDYTDQKCPDNRVKPLFSF